MLQTSTFPFIHNVFKSSLFKSQITVLEHWGQKDLQVTNNSVGTPRSKRRVGYFYHTILMTHLSFQQVFKTFHLSLHLYLIPLSNKPLLAWLFSEKTWGTARALASCLSVVIVVSQKLWHFVIHVSQLLLKIFPWNSKYLFTIQGAIHTITGDNTKCFFLKLCIFFDLRHFILYEATHSLMLAPAWVGLVFPCLSTSLLKIPWEKEKLLVTRRKW